MVAAMPRAIALRRWTVAVIRFALSTHRDLLLEKLAASEVEIVLLRHQLGAPSLMPHGSFG
jgi:hypothetical protein